MIFVAIVDDENAFIQMYKKEVSEIFSKLGFECEISTYTDPDVFQKETIKIKYDLIFLDIDMPDISGMQIASELNKQYSNITLIFISNHSNFVFEAFRYSAYRFIRKENLSTDTEEAIRSFCDAFKTKPNYIVLNFDGENSVSIDLSEIKYFFSIRHDIYLFNKQKHSIRLTTRSYTLNDLENKLRDNGFIRIHRTYLVNYLYIYQIQREKVILKDKSELSLSRGRYESVKKIYQKLICERGAL